MHLENGSGPLMLPEFRYHPDPVGTGSIVAADVNCVSCGQLRRYTYTGPVRSPLADLDDADICPWCISDGTAARRFDAEFTDVSWNVPDDVPAATKFEVAHRTPGYLAWQESQWLYHCGDAAAFLGLVGYQELVDFPDALECLRNDMRSSNVPVEQIEKSLTWLGKDHDMTAYLFRCLVCGVHLAYWDAN